MLKDPTHKPGLMFPVIALLTLVAVLYASPSMYAQAATGDSILSQARLPDIIQYALRRQPLVQQAVADEKITDLQVKSKLADWYPQVNFNYLYQHNFQVQRTIIGGNEVRLGVENTSALQFTASQSIFNRDVLLAKKTRSDVRLQSTQQTENIRTALVSDVSKAFYDVLATEQQIRVAEENIVRLERSYNDAKAAYDAGVVDKTDYKRASIALNNSRASRHANAELLKAKTAYLKALMNYPETAQLPVVYDSATLEREIVVDTLQVVDYGRRIEFRQLETQKRLQEANLQYNKWSFIPSLSANGAYNLNYLNDDFGKLYNQSLPNSYAGLTLSFPIFQGGKRKYNIDQARWQVQRTDLAIVSLKNQISSEYMTALAGYKASFASYQAVRENVLLAREVYDVINLQYRSGIKTYLEVITAETDLRTAQINYFNALYQVLSSKIDVLRTLGQLQF